MATTLQSTLVQKKQNGKPTRKFTFKRKCIETSSVVLNEPNNTNIFAKSKTKFKFKKTGESGSRVTFKRKTSNQKKFINFCKEKQLNYFEFYDENCWTGPAIKVIEDDYDNVVDELNRTHIKYMVLNGYGFVIIRSIGESLKTETIVYSQENYDNIGFTQKPIIPYNTEDESDSDFEDSDDESVISIEEEFIAEEWTYNGTTYLLDTETNCLYFPTTMEFIGKKTGEFSIDFDSKES